MGSIPLRHRRRNSRVKRPWLLRQQRLQQKKKKKEEEEVGEEEEEEEEEREYKTETTQIPLTF